jgi:hypothetical protein
MLFTTADELQPAALLMNDDFSSGATAGGFRRG